jgi:hypothetical protein
VNPTCADYFTWRTATPEKGGYRKERGYRGEEIWEREISEGDIPRKEDTQSTRYSGEMHTQKTRDREHGGYQERVMRREGDSMREEKDALGGRVARILSGDDSDSGDD